MEYLAYPKEVDYSQSLLFSSILVDTVVSCYVIARVPIRRRGSVTLSHCKSLPHHFSLDDFFQP